MRKHLKLMISLALTIAILAVLYSMVDMDAFLAVLSRGEPVWLGAYLALFIPQLLVAGLRWQSLVDHFGGTRLSFGLAFSQCMGAYAANLLIPGKLGELVKGAWLNTGERKFLPYFLVALEKILDLLAMLGLLTVALMLVLPSPQYQPRPVLAILLGLLLVCWIIGLTLLKGTWPVRLVNRFILKGDEAKVQEKWRSVMDQKGKLLVVAAQSILLWTLQLLQFWCMFRIFGVAVDVHELFVGVPMALLAGVMPLTTGGVGVRDAALLWYYGSAISMEIVLSVGILSFLRILLVGLAGVPFFFVRMREGKHGK